MPARVVASLLIVYIAWGATYPAIAVLVLDLGIGWLWAAFSTLMVARLVALLARWRRVRA